MPRTKEFIASARLRTAILMMDVIRRADAEYIPIGVFVRVLDLQETTARETLNALAKHKIFVGLRGARGGYRWARRVSLYELFQIFTPSRLPVRAVGPYGRKLNTCYSAIERALKEAVFIPEKAVPLDYELDSDDGCPVFSSPSPTDTRKGTDALIYDYETVSSSISPAKKGDTTDASPH